MEFVQQFGGAYFSTEGALWRTLALLLFKPGELTRQYRAGRRKHYVLPLRLYITISLLSLLALRWVMPVNLKNTNDSAFELGPKANISIMAIEDDGFGLKDGVFYCRGMPVWVCEQAKARLDIDPKTFARELKRLPERFISHWGTAMFLLLPVFALLHKLAYLRSRLYYTEHLVYALHVHSFWFAALAVALIPIDVLPAAMACVVPLYTLLAARRVYGGGWWATLWRAGLVSCLYLIVLSVALAVVLLWAFLG
jgi:hypothetical protein